jgi:hypothetical protein
VEGKAVCLGTVLAKEILNTLVNLHRGENDAGMGDDQCLAGGSCKDADE